MEVTTNLNLKNLHISQLQVYLYTSIYITKNMINELTKHPEQEHERNPEEGGVFNEEANKE